MTFTTSSEGVLMVPVEAGLLAASFGVRAVRPFPAYGGTWSQRQYFRLEIRLASHSLNRSHRVCIGAPGMTLTVHLAVSNMEDSPNDHSPAIGGSVRQMLRG